MYLLLGLLTAIPPLSIDLYLPGLPDLARALGTSSALAQLTMSATLVGLAVGQLVLGPLSDRIGRRPPLLVGLALFAGLSFLCALAPSVWVLLGLRLLQGLSGSAAVVISRAAVRDVHAGPAAARVFSRLMLVMGVAPVIAPVLGGQILRFTSWRGLFVSLGVLGTLLLLAAFLVLRETMPVGRRQHGPGAELARSVGRLMVDRRFLGYAAITGLQGATLFSYIAMSSFVLRQQYGVSVQAFSAVFAVNAVGLVAGGQLNAALVERTGPARMLRIALGTGVLAAGLLTLAASLGAALLVVLAPLFVVLFCLGIALPDATALGMAPYGHAAGSAAAVLGTSQFLAGAVIPPVVSLAGTRATVMAAAMLVSCAGAAAVLHGVIRADARRAGEQPRAA
jgi:DHA1 family bicyclomycin/chloramphenicol resistance-like MFS transporter